jgi:hypothetical protein
MGLRDASAMTEASGIADRDPGTIEPMSASAAFSEKASKEALLRTTDLLRKITIAAPLSSVAIAFMAGVLMSRKR